MAQKARQSTKTSKASKAPSKKPNVFRRFSAYLKNVRQEIKRTSWPSRDEVFRMSAIVIGALLFFGITIFSLDSIMTRLVALYARLAPSASNVEVESISNLLHQILSDLSNTIH